MAVRAYRALAGAALCVALLVLTYGLALHVGVFRRADASIFRGFDALQAHQRLSSVAERIANLCNPSEYVYLAAIPVAMAVIRRRPRILLAVLVILFAANLTTEVLKSALPDWRPVVGEGAWPSGHATAAMSLALCVVLAAPQRLRPGVAALGAAFAVAVSYSFLSLGWHYPSDVLGGFLVAAAWTLAAMAGIYAADARWPRRRPGEGPEQVSVRNALAPPLALVLGGAAVIGMVALARPHAVITFARAHEVFIVGAAAIAVLALAVSSVIALAMRR